MVVPVHGEVTVHWCGPVCISTLQGAFNEAGIARWFELVQQHWQQQGEPTEWAGVLDMQHWQGRTPECEALMREAVAWSMAHGLRFRILLLERGPDNIYFKLTQKANPVIPPNSNIAICQNYDEVVEALQQHGFSVSRECLMP